MRPRQAEMEKIMSSSKTERVTTAAAGILIATVVAGPLGTVGGIIGAAAVDYLTNRKK
jgi:hypothetical protein